jgi:hypothetical protein
VNAIAIGSGAGQTGQGAASVAIGLRAGATNQGGITGADGVAIGTRAGEVNQRGGSFAMGYQAGRYNQLKDSIAIGSFAGETDQGINCIAIGKYAGQTSQTSGSIVINTSGLALNTIQAGFYVDPVRNVNTGVIGALQYDTASKEITNNVSKTFVIDHPIHPHKYLVHACLEGPESGVYYRGKGEIVNGISVDVQLPAYVGALCPEAEFTVQLTHIYDGAVKVFSASEVDPATNSFRVYGENGRFNWLVHGKRLDIEVEPNKADVNRHGDGPYTYLSQKK